MKFFLTAFFVTLLASSCATVSHPAPSKSLPSPVPVKPKPQSLTLTWEPGAPPYLAAGFVTLSGQKLLVIADTGSPFSYIYPSEEAQRFLRLVGPPIQQGSQSLTFDHVTLGGATFSELTLRVGRYRNAGRDYPRALVLGADALAQHWLSWKAAAHTLTISLQKPRFHGVDLPCSLIERQDAGPSLVFDGNLAGQPARFLLDTGNGSSFARLQGAEGSAPIPVRGIAPGGDTWNLSLYSSSPIQLGPLSWPALPVLNEPKGAFAGRLGFSFFRGTDWCVFLGRTATQSPEFLVKPDQQWLASKTASYGFGLGLYLIEGGWTVIVSEVLPGLTGLPALGAQVTAVNGFQADGKNFPRIWEALQQPELELSWIEGHQILTRNFQRTVMTTPEQDAL
ncbi:MAG: hypothetical protein HKM05_02215 [Spirochaetales bacterium]|nr:hypothetical protein [Spirochaetales bacterium]